MFETGKIATQTVKDYCLQEKKGCKLSSHSGMHNKYICLDGLCDWKVNVSRSQAGKPFRLTSYNLEHSTLCTSNSKICVSQMKKMNSVKGIVNNNSNISANLIMSNGFCLCSLDKIFNSNTKSCDCPSN